MNGVTVLTWGATPQGSSGGTSAWMKRTPSCLARRRSPHLQKGFDFAQRQADLHDVVLPAS
ncbi:MAG: hypothetical protein DMG41_06315 [Acidobacteria bacterium]|nr:MAG: hypothetical protein DMG41_06315 [Acidobacteriota bacterium]